MMESNPKYYDPVEMAWRERLYQQPDRNFIRYLNWILRKREHDAKTTV